MSPPIQITIDTPEDAKRRSKRPKRNQGATASNARFAFEDPKADTTLNPVDDPRDDTTLNPVDDPRHDGTLNPVDDPNGLLQALVQSLTAEGGGGSWNLQVNPGGASCCCQDHHDEEEEAPDGAAGLEKSGFVIVSLKPAYLSPTAESLCALAQEFKPQLQGLAEILGCNLGSTILPEAEPTKLESWPLIFFCRETPCGPERPKEDLKKPKKDCASILNTLETGAATSALPPLRSLRSYWRIDARHLGDEAEDLVRRLQALGEVNVAYRELAADDAGSQYATFGADQSYLDEAPLGTGASCLPSPDKPVDIHIVDLEQGWNPEHWSLDLAAKTLEIFVGENRRTDPANGGHHGTAVLGQLCGKASQASQANLNINAYSPSPGVEGFLPGATISATSHYFGATVPPLQTTPGHPLAYTNGHIANAIVAALWSLAVDINNKIHLDRLPGKLLLIEAQRSHRPVEAADLADFDAIRLASALGVTVIEAAGNGGVDLDAEAEKRGWPQISRRASGFADSGAILVGAAGALLPHNRMSFSNYGSRVDCYGWGDRVTSCGYGDLYGEDSATYNDFYTGTFAGTSSAAAVIAGAAALLQGLHQEALASPLAPLALRSLLADPATGTPQGRDVAGHIGVLPNLKAILVEGLCLASKTYLRNHPCDDGSDPAPQDFTSSPDIVIGSEDFQPPGGAGKLGEGSGSAYGPALGFPGDPTIPKYLYVRARNGGLKEETLYFDLYACRPASLLTPKRWLPVTASGATLDLTALSGDQLTVSTELNWTPSGAPLNLKLKEAAAWLAVAREEGSQVPLALPPDGRYFRFSDLFAFHRQRRVACRNTHRVKAAWAAAPLSDAVHALRFDLTSAPDQPRTYDFEIFQRLPGGAKVTLDIPLALAAKLRQSNPMLHWKQGDIYSKPQTGSTTKPTPQELWVSMQLPPAPCLRLPGIPLAAGICCPATFSIQGPTLKEGHSLAVRQLVQGVEVGRITWLIRP